MLQVSNAFGGGCYPADWTMERSDRTFDIRYTSEGCIPEQVGGWAFEHPLGTLEPGPYTVRLWHNGELKRTYTFVVTLADPPVRVVAPYASTRGGTRVLLVKRDEGGFAGATVLIDGVEVPTEEALHNIIAIAPAHAAGSVNVEVRTVSGAIFTAPYALRYVDPAAPVDPAVFERVLIPILYNGPGAFGSQWVTETEVEPGSEEFEWFHDFERAACKVSCSRPPALSDFRDHPAGMMVAVPRQYGPLFSLRIRDVSRTETSYGAEIPIAREKDFRYELTFADVPFDPRYRLMLRLYSMSGVSTFTNVTGPGPDASHVQLLGPCALPPSCASVQPAFGVADLKVLFPALAGQGPKTVRTYGFEPHWGFITVTNNETQQVTVISPMR